MKVTIRLEDEDVVKLKEIAELRGITFSKLVREIVSEKLDSEQNGVYTYLNESTNVSEIC